MSNLLKQILEASNANKNEEKKSQPLSREENTKRALDDLALAESQGHAMKDTYYEVGRGVVEIGKDNARSYKQEFEDMPHVKPALIGLREKVQAENRQDVTVNSDDLDLCPDSGRLVVPRVGSVDMTQLAMDHMMSLMPDTPRYASKYLMDVPNMRRHLEFRNIVRSNASQALKVRLRTPENGNQTAYAIATPKYQAYDPDRLANDILRLVNGRQFEGAKAKIDYMGTRTDIRIITNSDVSPENYVVGEIFRMALAISMGDDKSRGIHFWCEVLRNLCLNLILLDANKRTLESMRHMGSMWKMRQKAESALRKGANAMQPWLEKWSEKRDSRVADPLQVLQVLTMGKDARAGVPIPKAWAKPAIKVPGMKGKDAFELMAEAWRKEPEDNQVGLVNAITRAAHEGDHGVDTFDFLKSVGSDLLDWNIQTVPGVASV